MTAEKPVLYLIDGHGLIFRAHFALIRSPLFTSKGFNTSAVFGFTNMVLKLVRDRKPDYLAMAFDMKGETFRHKLFDEYKAHRPKTPPEIIAQEPYIRRVVQAMNIPILEREGFEADDIIATLSDRALAEGFDVLIVTKDKDAFQLISPRVKVLAPAKGISELELIDELGVMAKFGVRPDQIVDYLSLVGDTSDNVPGVPSVGEKTATALLKQFDTLENMYAGLEQVSKTKLRETLATHHEDAFMSKRLIVLDRNVPLELDPSALKTRAFDNDSLRDIFRELEFKDMMKLVAPQVSASSQDYVCVDTEEKLEQLLARLKKVQSMTLDTETDNINPLQANLVGISLSYAPNQAYYLPCGHEFERERQFETRTLLDRLKPFLSDASLTKIGHNIKYDWEVFERYQITLAGVKGDTMLAAYLIEPERRKHDLDSLTLNYLDQQKTPTEALIGKGAKAITMDRLPIDQVCHYSCEDADTTFRLNQIFLNKLAELDLSSLYAEVEVPLIPVLMRMEQIGVKLDLPLLEKLEQEFSQQLHEFEEAIFAEAGETFNINSPKQLSTILFEKLQYPTRGIKKTTLGYSTDEASLQKLIHPGGMFRQLPEILLDYRSLTKLLNTYVIALKTMADPTTHRVHTSYNQTVTETGRLSSSDPNLQNIPIRTEMGREIRKAFIAENEDWCMLSADYSQVELRILADMANDQSMIEAFHQGHDIHAHTAAEVFNVPLESVTAEQRRMAKTINFGIDYGMTEWGLSSRLNIPVNKARTYISNYLDRYAGVRAYIEQTIAFARQHGFVQTLLNRRRYLPDINARQKNVREAAERKAINMPIQGTAAELIKKAMITIQTELQTGHYQTRMLLQVHDELVFEVFKPELDRIRTLIKSNMENAIHLKVPLSVDIAWGNNWAEAH
ncbi:DNA polymerase I [bacterium]|nr:DNA polymerase I [bacterium]